MGGFTANFGYQALLYSGLAAGIIFYPTEATRESVGTVCTKSGTYQIREASPAHSTKEEQLDSCRFYVEAYEKVLTPSSWYRPILMESCGIDPDDIVKNMRG